MAESNPSFAELVRAGRDARNWTQARLAQEVGTTQQTIDKIERGLIGYGRYSHPICLALGIDPKILSPHGPRQHRPAPPLPPAGYELPVYGVTQGGKGGALILTPEPVDWVRPLGAVGSYGVIVQEDSMAPEFEPGDIALVNPTLPPVIGKTCIFVAQDPDGTRRSVIKRLRRVTSEAWHVRQWNPRDGDKADFSLRRSEWQTCHLTVGRYWGR